MTYTLMRNRVVLALGDVALAHVATYLAFWLRFWGQIPEYNYVSFQTVAPYMAIAVVVLFYLYDLYSREFRSWNETLYSVVLSVLILSLLSGLLSFYLRSFSFPRTVILLLVPTQLVVLGAWRYLVWAVERKLAPSQRVLLVGSSEDIACLHDKLKCSERTPECVGQVVPGADHSLLRDQLSEWFVRGGIDGIYVCGGVEPEARRIVVEECLDHGKQAYLIPTLYEILLTQARVTQVDDTPVFVVGKLEVTGTRSVLKRLLDIGLSLLGLVLTSPVMATIAVLIRLDSPGPALFVQPRVTKDGHDFNLYKFRTMVEDAESETGAVFSSKDDPRQTRLGKMLRATRLDELPQLYNVLRGDMSLVGPRPERPVFVEQFCHSVPGYAHRLKVKPGLTGLAQVSGRYSTSVEDKLRYDILYATSHSIPGDLRILIKTLRTVVMKERSQ